jgi:hypothetical protein
VGITVLHFCCVRHNSSFLTTALSDTDYKLKLNNTRAIVPNIVTPFMSYNDAILVNTSSCLCGGQEVKRRTWKAELQVCDKCIFEVTSPQRCRGAAAACSSHLLQQQARAVARSAPPTTIEIICITLYSLSIFLSLTHFLSQKQSLSLTNTLSLFFRSLTLPDKASTCRVSSCNELIWRRRSSRSACSATAAIFSLRC